MKINIGETCLEVSQTRHAKLEWGGADEISITAFNDQGRTVQCGEKSITRSGNCKGQIINLVKIIGDEARPGNYYFSAKVGDKTADFEWEKPEIVSNSPTTPPDSIAIQTLPDNPVKLPNHNVIATEPAKVKETKLADLSTDSATDDVAELRTINSRQVGALDLLNKFGSLPHWMNNDELDGMMTKTREVQGKYPENLTVKLLAKQIFAREKPIRDALAKTLKSAKEPSRAPDPAPETKKPVQKPTTPGPGEDHDPLARRVGDLEKNLDEVKGELGGKASKKDLEETKKDLGKKIDEGFGAVGMQIAGLNKPATSNQKSDDSGNGGNNGGGKASADKNPPKSADRSWIMLLLGILGTLLLFIGVGGWIVSSLLGGWILGSKGPSAGFTPAMVPPVVMITNNAVAPVTPPAVQQAVTSTQPVLTPEEIQAYANKHLAMQIQANKVTENIPGLTSHPVDQTTKGGKEINNSGIIGNGNTIINNYHQAPDVHRNGNQAVTPRQTDDVTPTNTTMAVRPDSDWTGPRVVRTLPNWSPTGTFGKVEFLDLYGPGTGFSSE